MFSLTDGQLSGMVSIFRRIEKLNGNIEYDLLAIFRSVPDALDFIKSEVSFGKGRSVGVLCGGVLLVVNRWVWVDEGVLYHTLTDIMDRQLSEYDNTMGWLPELDLLPECEDSDDDGEGE